MAGLHVYRSNHLEALAARLAEIVRVPLTRVLQPELIVVQSLGMRRWLSQQLALRCGVAMNVQFPFPASFAHRVFEAAFPGEAEVDAFSREVLPWRVLGLFPHCLARPGWEPLQRYAEGELTALKEYQLAQRIAAVFDRYLAYRPELLVEWQAGRGGDWQGELWRELTKQRSHRPPPALLRQLDQADAPPPGALPERLALFGISSLPPFYLHLLQIVARQRDVHLFLLEPTDQYWGDIRSRREQDRLLREGEESAEDLHLETGNPLLASLGKVGRDFTWLVQDLEPVAEVELFVPPRRTSLLQQVQADIFELVERTAPELVPADGSLRLHCCHGPMREVEVLHDQLLQLFEEQPGLTPRDILVALPEIEKYAPFIEAVFGAPDDERHAIPFSIADQSARCASGLADTFLSLLDLHGSRFTAPAVLALLEDPALRRKFALTENDLDLIRDWVARTGIRWGIDAAHRAQLGQPEFGGNTWREGLARLLLGYALPGDGQTLFDGVLPVREVEGALADALGRFAAFTETLFTMIPGLAAPRPLGQWEQTLRQLLRACFDDGDEAADEARHLREVFATLGTAMRTADFTAPVTFEVLRAHLGAALEDTDSGAGFLAGHVTFCALKPMRAIPFKVICLLGMNGTAFPRRDHAPAFDLIASQRARRGDRSQRDDDRQLFLEALLSARDVFYVSYSGLSPRDNSEAPPSVVVSEVLDYLSENFALSAETLVTRHRLHPFSPAYFGSDPRLFSYSAENAQASQRGRGPRESIPAFAATPLPAPEPEWREVDVARLATFFSHPARFFVRERLQVKLPAETEPLEETEPLSLHWRDRYQTGQDLTATVLAGGSPEDVLPVARAAGMLPAGYAGRAEFREVGKGAEQLAASVRELVPDPALPPLSIDVTLDGWRLTGTLHGVHPQGQLRYRLAGLKGADWLCAWVWHVALQFGTGAPRETLLCGKNEAWRLRPLADPHAALADLLALYEQGLTAPLPLFPRTSLEFARRKLQPSAKEKKDPLEAARKEWAGSDFGESRAERDDAWFQLCFPEDPLDAAWQAIALRVFGPILEAREEVNA